METLSNSEKLSPQARSSIKVIFLTLFLDLVGFSIIFPLFPALIEHYNSVDPNNFFLQMILATMSKITQWGGVAQTVSPIVLFGGILGALYSFLQFIFAPFWGALSDRVGRKPILIISVSGIVLCYLIWIVSGSFTLLILSRVIGGIMAGNISTATAVIGDITTAKTRSRGMAIVGIAFGTGFIFGPALGGIFSLVRFDQMFPDLVAYGINPFSAPALLAFVLSVINLIFIAKVFKETLPKEKRGTGENYRSANLLKLFKPLPQKGVNLTNFTNFFFLMAFSGMEFTLTFLAVERLSYSSMDNGFMFIYIGVLIALIQGGYVRRKAHQVGEKRMALMGMVMIIPGLIILSFIKSSLLLYVGLTFLAIGSAMIIPCLTALVSLFASAQTQGRAIGTFRSLGSLARVIGPFSASIVYWKFGASTAYIIGAVMILIPIFLITRLMQPEATEQSSLAPRPSSL